MGIRPERVTAMVGRNTHKGMVKMIPWVTRVVDRNQVPPPFGNRQR